MTSKGDSMDDRELEDRVRAFLAVESPRSAPEHLRMRVAEIQARANSTVRPSDAAAIARGAIIMGTRPRRWRALVGTAGARRPRLAGLLLVALLVALLAGAVALVGSRLLDTVPTPVLDQGTFTPAGTLDELLEAGSFTATGLSDGRVLIIGGCAACAVAQLWNSSTMTFTPAGSLPEGRVGHAATLLPDGRVLVLGGYVPPDKSQTHPSVPAELWDPRTLSFSAAGTHRDFDLYAPPTATVLPDGRVLIGEDTTTGEDATFELWDPVDRSFSPAGTLPGGRLHYTAVGLGDGRVLIVGGTIANDAAPAGDAEVWNPRTESFSPAGTLAEPRTDVGRDAVGGRSCPGLGWLCVRRQHSPRNCVRRGVEPGHRGIQPCRDHV